jgi:hypothetical protein
MDGMRALSGHRCRTTGPSGQHQPYQGVKLGLNYTI